MSTTPDLDADIGVGMDSVRLYLNAIGRRKLLTAVEEVTLSRNIEAGLMADYVLAGVRRQQRGLYRDMHALAADGSAILAQSDLPTNGKQAGLIQIVSQIRRIQETLEVLTDYERDLVQVSEDGVSARTRMLESNLRLVVSVAKRHANREVQLLDVIQDGSLGLVRAVEKFDYTRGFKFSTYASWWIKQAITRAAADNNRVIRLPVHLVEQTYKVRKAIAAKMDLDGIPPSTEEIAETTGLSLDKVILILDVDRLPVSLSTSMGEDSDSFFGDFIEDTTDPRPEDIVVIRDRDNLIRTAIGTYLHGREREILELRFGLIDGKEQTLDQIGKKFDLSRERIRQIERVALAKLRHPSVSGLLEGYYGASV